MAGGEEALVQTAHGADTGAATDNADAQGADFGDAGGMDFDAGGFDSF